MITDKIITFMPALNILYVGKPTVIESMKHTPRGFLADIDEMKGICVTEEVKCKLIHFAGDDEKKLYIKALKEARESGLSVEEEYYNV